MSLYFQSVTFFIKLKDDFFKYYYYQKNDKNKIELNWKIIIHLYFYRQSEVALCFQKRVDAVEIKEVEI